MHRLSFYKIYCEEVVLNLCISTSSLYMRINVCTATDGTYQSNIFKELGNFLNDGTKELVCLKKRSK